MDGFSAAASAFAAVSLALQLVEAVKKISDFLHSVQEAPSEVLKLAESLDQLHQHLIHSRLLLEQQSALPQLPGSFSALAGALASCEAKVQQLERVVSKVKTSLTGQKRWHRKWASVKLVC